MSFLPELTSFLEEKGKIYTVRHLDYGTSIVTVEDVGLCKRLFIRGVYCKDDLLPYLSFSGFTSIQDWWKKIRSFIRPPAKMYLYEVTKL